MKAQLTGEQIDARIICLTRRQYQTFFAILEWRNQNWPREKRGYIITREQILYIAEALPESEEQLLGVKGLGEVKVRQFGSALLGIINHIKERSARR